MAKQNKVETVKSVVKKKAITHYHVRVGGHPVQTFEDEALAQHYAVEEKASLVRRGCDIRLDEFKVTVEEESKEIETVEVVAA